jgi:hypothetical protein
VANIFLDAQIQDVLPSSPFGIAIGYVQNNWEALTRYASSGYLSIDNNVCEQRMKTIAIGRKNWLVTGSENSANNPENSQLMYLRIVLLIMTSYVLDRQPHFTSRACYCEAQCGQRSRCHQPLYTRGQCPFPSAIAPWDVCASRIAC